MSDKLNEAMQVFKQHYLPAANINESDEQLTTSEIWDKLWELFHDDKITNDEIYELMKEHGFIYIYHLDGFKWLLKFNK
jgi:hypothetical protein